MQREEILNKIHIQFEKCAEVFCKKTKGSFYEIEKEYKGEAKPINLKYMAAKVYYNSLVVKFIYTAHGTLNVVNSILGAVISFGKNEKAPEIPLPLFADYCNADIASPMYIPLITNEKGMEQAFDCIGGVLHQLLPRAIEISYNPEKKTNILKNFVKEIKAIFDIRSVNFAAGMEIYNFFQLRFTSTAFINYINGNLQLAIQQLEKEKNPTAYEKRVLEIWKSQQQAAVDNLPAIVENTKTYNKKGVQKTNWKEFGLLVLSWILLTPLTSLFYTGIYFLLYVFEKRGSVLVLGPVYNYPFCIVFGFVTAIALSYFTMLRIYKWFFKRDFQKYCELYSIQNGGKADRFMKHFAGILCVIGVLGCILMVKWNVKFMPDGIIDNTRFLSVKGDYYSADEIQEVYYKPVRVNDFDETLDAPSYVIVLKNGKEIDLYEYGEIKDYESALLEILQDIPIQ